MIVQVTLLSGIRAKQSSIRSAEFLITNQPATEKVDPGNTVFTPLFHHPNHLPAVLSFPAIRAAIYV